LKQSHGLVAVAMGLYLWGAPAFAGGTPPKPVVHLPDGVSPAWWSDVQRQLDEGEYELSRAGAGRSWAATNRAQRFEVSFPDDSVRLTGAEAKRWSLDLKLVGYGSGETLEPVRPGAHAPFKNTRELHPRTISH